MIYRNQDGGINRITNIIHFHNYQNPSPEECGVYDRFVHSLGKSRAYNDTFNVLNKYSSIAWMDVSDTLPLDKLFAASTAEIPELLENRIGELLKEHQHLTVLWSGGYDSTTVVSAMLKYGVPYDRYAILFNNGSIEESPLFYEFMVRNKLPMINLQDASLYEYLDNCKESTHYIVCAPEVFWGWSTALFVPYEKCYFEPWTDAIPRHLNLNAHDADQFCVIFNEYLTHLGLQNEVANTIDLLWVYGCSAMYTQTKSHFASELKLDSAFRFNNSLFFGTPEFFNWGFRNRLHHTKDQIENYVYVCREPERDFILSVFDSDEIRYKKKVSSQQRELAKYRNPYITITYDTGAVKIPAEYSDFVKEIIQK